MSTSLGNWKPKKLNLTGSLDVERGSRIGSQNDIRLLVMGPTGAGKSSFIEALAGPDSTPMRLSSGRLEGFTQDVSAFKIGGITSPAHNIIWLVDTPGFSDDKISAMEIVTKIQAFFGRKDNIYGILYLCPITSTRLSGSQRQVLKTFKALTGLNATGGITIVTTMWDRLYGEQAHIRAETNFEQLNSDIWKDYTDQKAKITKFHNTQLSALQVLDLVFERFRDEAFQVEDAIWESTPAQNTTFCRELYIDLVDRIQALQMRKNMLVSDLAGLSDVSVPENEQDLKSILIAELTQVNNTLVKFEQQFRGFDKPPADLSPADTVTSGSPVIIPPKKGRMTRFKDSTKRLVDAITRRDAH